MFSCRYCLLASLHIKTFKGKLCPEILVTYVGAKSCNSALNVKIRCAAVQTISLLSLIIVKRHRLRHANTSTLSTFRNAAPIAHRVVQELGVPVRAGVSPHFPGNQIANNSPQANIYYRLVISRTFDPARALMVALILFVDWFNDFTSSSLLRL